jgi:hypothetical protein
MKKIIFILIIGFMLFFQTISYAQTPEASPTAKTISPTISIEEKDIKNFGDKIATKVAELTKDKNNKAISGFIKTIKNSTITITDENQDTFEVKTDDVLTKYYQVAGIVRKEIKFENLKTGMFLIMTGVLNDKTIIANSIYVDEMFVVKSGKITEINKDDYTLKVLTTEKDTYILGVETTTKQQMVNVKTLVLENSGFSKIKEGDTIQFVVKKTGTEKDNTFTAVKFIVIPQEYFMK